MKSVRSLIRLKHFLVEERRRDAGQMEAMIASLEVRLAELQGQIEAEEKRTGIFDATQCAYSPLAKAAIVQRENLRRSIEALKSNLDSANQALSVAMEELKDIEILGGSEDDLRRSNPAQIDSRSFDPRRGNVRR